MAVLGLEDDSDGGPITINVTIILIIIMLVTIMDAPTVSGALNKLLFRQVLISVLMMSVAVILIVLIGGFANETYNQHR